MNISDQIIDNIQISWDGEPEYIFTKAENVPEEYMMLTDFLKITNWVFIRFMAEGIVARSSRGMNDSGFRYAEDLDEQEERFEGVRIYDYYDAFTISEPAFIRMMSRLLDVLVIGAESHHLAVTKEGWWTEFVDLSVKIQQMNRSEE